MVVKEGACKRSSRTMSLVILQENESELLQSLFFDREYCTFV